MNPIARKSTKVFVTYLMIFILSTLFIILIQASINELNLEYLFILGLLYASSIACLISFLIMLFSPKILVYATEQELIIKRFFRTISIKTDSIISVDNQHAHMYLGRYRRGYVEHGFGVLVIKTRSKKYYVIGVEDLSTVKSSIMLLKNNTNKSKFFDS